jgi:P pilus assembly chaperone PapD
MRKCFFNYLGVFLILLLLTPSLVFASKISLGQVIVNFDAANKKSYTDVPVFNESKGEKSYVKVTVYEVHNPGTEDERVVLVPKGKGGGLIASPQKFIIQPGGVKNLRLISLDRTLKKDRVYRVNVAPVYGDFKTEKKRFVKILVAYDILVFVHPKDKKVDFEATREGKRLIFVNKGNVGVLFVAGKQCSKANPSDCIKVKGARLNVDAKRVVELPRDSEVEFTYTSDDLVYKKIYR